MTHGSKEGNNLGYISRKKICYTKTTLTNPSSVYVLSYDPAVQNARIKFSDSVFFSINTSEQPDVLHSKWWEVKNATIEQFLNITAYKLFQYNIWLQFIRNNTENPVEH